MDIIDLEQPHGVIVSTGGQIPNNLAMNLDRTERANPGYIAAKDIDNAEDRAKFSADARPTTASTSLSGAP